MKGGKYRFRRVLPSRVRSLLSRSVRNGERVDRFVNCGYRIRRGGRKRCGAVG